MIYEDKWIKIELLERKPKTEVYEVRSKYSDCPIGLVHWYPSWRHYTFEPLTDYKIELSDRCLFALGSFVMQLNSEHTFKLQYEKHG